MQLLILISVFVSSFSIFLNTLSTLISYITILQLTLHRLAFDNYFFFQKLFFFSILLFFFILILNITISNCFLTTIIFLYIKSVVSISISRALSIILFIVAIIIFLIFFSLLIQIFTSNSLRKLCTNSVIFAFLLKRLQANKSRFLLTILIQLFIQFLSNIDFFSSLSIIFFNFVNYFFMRQLFVVKAML